MSNNNVPGSNQNVNVQVRSLTTDPNVTSQYKTKILHKNVVNGVNTLTQAMMNDTNTKYVIKYDYVLGENITVPANCVLEFDGGSLSNGSIDGNGSTFNYDCGYSIFNDCDIVDFNIPYIDIRWFGAKSDLQIENVIEDDRIVSQTVTGTDCHDALAKAIEVSNKYDTDNRKYRIGTAIPVKLIGNFYLATKVSIDMSLRLEGTYYGTMGEAVLPNLYVAGGITAFEIDRYVNGYENIISIKNISVLSKGNYIFPKKEYWNSLFTSTFLDYSCQGAPSRPGLIAESLFMGFAVVFYFHAQHQSGESVYCNLDIKNNVIMRNQWGIRSSYDYVVEQQLLWYDPTLQDDCAWKDVLTLLNIHDNVIEANGRYGMQLYGTWGGLNICDNLLESDYGAIDIITDYAVINIERNYFEGNNRSVNPDWDETEFSIRVIAPQHSTNDAPNLTIKNNIDEGRATGPSRNAAIIVQGVYNNLEIENNGKLPLNLADVKTHLYKGFHTIPNTSATVRKFTPIKWKPNVSGATPTDVITEIVNGIPVYTIGSDGTNDTKITYAFRDNVSAAVGDYIYIVYGAYLKEGEKIPLRIYNQSDSTETHQRTFTLDRGDGWYTIIQKVYIKYAMTRINFFNELKRELKITDIYIYLNTTDLLSMGIIQTPSIGPTSLRPDLVPNGFEFYDTTLNRKLHSTLITIGNHNGVNWVEEDEATAGVKRIGETTDRPTGYDIYVGFQYFDTTLGKPIYTSAISGNTVTWVDATGTPV